MMPHVVVPHVVMPHMMMPHVMMPVVPMSLGARRGRERRRQGDERESEQVFDHLGLLLILPPHEAAAI
jgi:hypothetical protein